MSHLDREEFKDDSSESQVDTPVKARKTSDSSSGGSSPEETSSSEDSLLENEKEGPAKENFYSNRRESQASFLRLDTAMKEPHCLTNLNYSVN